MFSVLLVAIGFVGGLMFCAAVILLWFLEQDKTGSERWWK